MTSSAGPRWVSSSASATRLFSMVAECGWGEERGEIRQRLLCNELCNETRKEYKQETYSTTNSFVVPALIRDSAPSGQPVRVGSTPNSNGAWRIRTRSLSGRSSPSSSFFFTQYQCPSEMAALHKFLPDPKSAAVGLWVLACSQCLTQSVDCRMPFQVFVATDIFDSPAKN